MLKITPKNEAAEQAQLSLTCTNAGLVVMNGFRLFSRKGRFSGIAEQQENTVFQPTVRQMIIIQETGQSAPSKAEFKDAVSSPANSERPIFEIEPVGVGLYAMSRIALNLSLLFLVGGIAVGLAAPTATRLYALKYVGGDFNDTEVHRKIINDLKVAKPEHIDERTKSFFDAFKKAKKAREGDTQ